jgi:hypothetical protein
MAITLTFYKQLLSAQIRKMQKNTVKLSVNFALLGSAHAKAASRLLLKLTPGVLTSIPRRKMTKSATKGDSSRMCDARSINNPIILKVFCQPSD